MYPKVVSNCSCLGGYYLCDLNCVANMAALIAENIPPHFGITKYISCLLLEVLNYFLCLSIFKVVFNATKSDHFPFLFYHLQEIIV